MKNFEHSRKLAGEASRTLKEAKGVFKERDWNYTIRRAQESVELHLKSLLCALGIEFPKIHDVGRFCIEELKRKNIKIPDYMSSQVIRISKELSEKRAPSFYWEQDYTQKEACDALNGAKFINLGEK